MTFVFNDQGNLSWSDARALFLQECLKAGVLTNGNLLTSYAHDEQAVKETLSGFRTALEAVQQALVSRGAAGALPVGGAMFEVAALQATGFIDQLFEGDNDLRLGGWILLNSGAADSVLVRSADGVEVEAEKTARPDLEKAFSNQAGAKWAGFQVTLPKSDFVEEDAFRFTVDAVANGQSRFQCIVNCRVGQAFSGPWSISDGVLYL